MKVVLKLELGNWIHYMFITKKVGKEVKKSLIGVNSVNKYTSSGTAHLGESFLYNTEVIWSSDWQIMFVINIFW